MSWTSPGDHLKDDEQVRRGLRLIESDNANKYHWMAAKVLGTPSTMNTTKAITNVDIIVDNSFD